MLGPMLIYYLDQLEAAARNAGVDLAEVCRAVGVAPSTLMRWRKGEMTPRQATAEQILNRIERMKRVREPAA